MKNNADEPCALGGMEGRLYWPMFFDGNDEGRNGRRTHICCMLLSRFFLLNYLPSIGAKVKNKISAAIRAAGLGNRFLAQACDLRQRMSPPLGLLKNTSGDYKNEEGDLLEHLDEIVDVIRDILKN